MKKFLVLSLVFISLSSSIFAKKFFDERYVEFRLDLPAGFSNNVISVNDVLKKDVVIDLKKIADGLPSSGADLALTSNPNFQLNLRFGKLFFGLEAGCDIYGKGNLSKDIFDFIAYGNEVGEDLDIDVDVVFDAFAYSEVSLGIKTRKILFTVTPGIFLPLATVGSGNTSLVFQNSEDGDISIDFTSLLDVYSAVDFTELNNKNLNFDYTDLLQNAGFDISGSLGFQIFKPLLVYADFRVPIMAGSLPMHATLTNEFSMSMNLLDFDSFSDPDSTLMQWDYDNNSKYKINRPLKFMGYLDFTPLGNFLDLKVGGGFGIRHPMSESSYMYPQYYAGLTLNFFNIFKVGVSSDYTDQIFKEQIGTVFNLRLFEIDAGLSMQSTSFIKSFTGCGAGFYITVAFGF